MLLLSTYIKQATPKLAITAPYYCHAPLSLPTARSKPMRTFLSTPDVATSPFRCLCRLERLSSPATPAFLPSTAFHAIFSQSGKKTFICKALLAYAVDGFHVKHKVS